MWLWPCAETGESYDAAKNATTDKPPLRMAPGQMLEERRKEDAAANKQPRASPALRGDWSADGSPSRMRPAATAIDKVEQLTAETETGGDTLIHADAMTVKRAETTPATSVLMLAAAEETSGDAGFGEAGRPELERAVLALDVLERGDGTTQSAVANAAYPRPRSEKAADTAKPTMSAMAQRSNTAKKPLCAESLCWSDADCPPAGTTPDTTAVTASRPVRMPPNCTAA